MKVVSINISKAKGTKKEPIEYAEVIENFGIKGDAHAGNLHKQISLLDVKSIEKIKREYGLSINPGDFSENITTEGINLPALHIGTKIKINDVILEVTQIGKPDEKDKIFKRFGEKIGRNIMITEGIFTKVLKGGIIKKGDEILIEK